MEIPINYFAVLAAAVSNMAIGFAWYGPVFGEMWKKLMGFTDESMRSMPLTALQASIGGFVSALVMAYVLAHILVFASAYTQTTGVAAGLMAGFWCWLGFVAPVTASVVLWEGKTVKLWALSAGYYFVAILVMGVILALWQ